MSAFHVDDRIEIKMEVGLAVRLGQFVLSPPGERVQDTQLLALAHKLCNLLEDEDANKEEDWVGGSENVVPTASASKYSSAEFQDKKHIRTMHDVMTSRNKIRWGVD